MSNNQYGNQRQGKHGSRARTKQETLPKSLYPIPHLVPIPWKGQTTEGNGGKIGTKTELGTFTKFQV